MNIFLFDPLDLKSQAKAHPDKLVVKMQLEASQLLANAMLHYGYGHIYKKDSTPYKPTHLHHPCSIWLCESEANASYCMQYLHSLIEEYESRYGKPSSFRSVYNTLASKTSWDSPSQPENFAIAINNSWLREFLQDKIISEPSYYKVTTTHRADPDLAKTLYRTYLLRAKPHYAEWRYSTPPQFWLNEAQLSKYFGRFCKI
jgi:hypothetical protein